MLHPQQKLIIQDAIQRITQRRAVPEEQGTGTVQAGGNQGNSANHDKINIKIILQK